MFAVDIRANWRFLFLLLCAEIPRFANVEKALVSTIRSSAKVVKWPPSIELD